MLLFDYYTVTPLGLDGGSIKQLSWAVHSKGSVKGEQGPLGRSVVDSRPPQWLSRVNFGELMWRVL